MSDPAQYEYASISPRSGAKLVSCYGFRDVASFAADLPSGASVLDVGAGRSTFGHEVAALRDDISWLNVDQHGRSITGSPDERSAVPSNLEFLAANVLDLPEALAGRRFDQVLSYWMLPYITLAGRDLGLLAAKNMLSAAKPEGKISIGPRTGARNFARCILNRECTVTLQAPERETDLDAAAEFIVDATTLGRFAGQVHRATTAWFVRQDPFSVHSMSRWGGETKTRANA